MPPLIVGDKEITAGMEKLEAACRACAATLKEPLKVAS
jgi:hypothetical protein